MIRVGIDLQDTFGRVAYNDKVLADSTGRRATLNCVLGGGEEHSVVGSAAEILSGKTKDRTLQRGSDYMKSPFTSSSKQYLESFLRDLIRTASTAGDGIEGIVLGVPAYRYVGDVRYSNEIVSVLKNQIGVKRVQICPSEILACVSLDMDRVECFEDVCVITLDSDSLRSAEIRVRRGMMRLMSSQRDSRVSDAMFDDAVMRCVMERYMSEDERLCVRGSVRVFGRLREACKEVKHKFSVKTARVANIHVELTHGKDFTCRLTRARYEAAVKKCVRKICDRIIEMMNSNNKRVVLIGDGATDLCLQDELKKRFQQVKQKIILTIPERPEETAVRGAAIQAQYCLINHDKNKIRKSASVMTVRLKSKCVVWKLCVGHDDASMNVMMESDDVLEILQNSQVVARREIALNDCVKISVIDENVTIVVMGNGSSSSEKKKEDVLKMKWIGRKLGVWNDEKKGDLEENLDQELEEDDDLMMMLDMD